MNKRHINAIELRKKNIQRDEVTIKLARNPLNIVKPVSNAICGNSPLEIFKIFAISYTSKGQATK